MVGRADFGVETPSVYDIPTLLDTAKEQWQANFCLVPLAHPRYWRDHRRPRAEQFTRSDLVLDSGAWSGQVVGKLSPWLQLDSPDETTRRTSEAAFKQEMAWASHLSLQSILMPPPAADAVNYAHCINQAVLASPHVHIWVRVPLAHPTVGDDKADGSSDAGADDEEAESGRGAWASWNRLRCLCEHAPNLGLALQMGEDLPDDPEELNRWCGEPLRAVIIPAAVFLTNKRGYPTLSRRHQAVLQQLMAHRPRLVVSGRPDSHSEGLGAHVQYLRYLVSKLAPQTQQERYESPYYDYLQAPLQPLQDNLESQTYETFEKASGHPVATKSERIKHTSALILPPFRSVALAPRPNMPKRCPSRARTGPGQVRAVRARHPPLPVAQARGRQRRGRGDGGWRGARPAGLVGIGSEPLVGAARQGLRGREEPKRRGDAARPLRARARMGGGDGGAGRYARVGLSRTGRLPRE